MGATQIIVQQLVSNNTKMLQKMSEVISVEQYDIKHWHI